MSGFSLIQLILWPVVIVAFGGLAWNNAMDDNLFMFGVDILVIGVAGFNIGIVSGKEL